MTVNAAHTCIDLLLHPAVLGTAATPPPDPREGDCWIVAQGATGPFAGRDDYIAGFQAGVWQFVAPRPGLRAFDAAAGHALTYDGTWRTFVAPGEPQGGTVVDAEARGTIATLIDCLIEAGILARD